MGGYNFWVSKEMLYKEKKRYYQPFSLPKSAFYITGFLNPIWHEWVNRKFSIVKFVFQYNPKFAIEV